MWRQEDIWSKDRAKLSVACYIEGYRENEPVHFHGEGLFGDVASVALIKSVLAAYMGANNAGAQRDAGYPRGRYSKSQGS